MREQHLSASARREENRKRNRRKKIFLLLFIIAVIAGIAAEVFVLMNMVSVDRRFVREVERSVIEGWSAGRGDLQLKESGAVTDVSFIDEELEAAEEFANKSYQDKTLKKLVRRYVNDLRECKNAAAAHDPLTDSDSFWKGFGIAYTDRLIVLRKLYTGDYKMGDSWEKYPEQLNEVLLKGWLADKASGLQFKRVKGKDGSDAFKASLKNDSGFDIEYLNLDVSVYNSKGNLSGDVKVYEEDIKNGSTAELVFYFSGNKAATYRIVGADCAGVSAETE